MSSSTEQRNTDASFATFVSAAVFNGSLTIGLYFTFCIIRRWDRKVYEPRTYLVDESNRSPELSRSLFGWLGPIFSASKKDIISKAGLDAYMFIRFFNMCVKLFTILSVVCLGILVPVTVLGDNGGLKGLEQFTIGNVSKEKNKLWAHVGVAYIVVSVTLLFLYREYKTFVTLRHEYYTRRERVKSASATTILVTGIPSELYNAGTLRTLFNIFPGGVKRIWLNRDPKKLPDLSLHRENLVRELESAATKLITSFDHSKVEPDTAREDGNDVPARLRPRHRKMFIGPSVDSLDYYHDELKALNEKIEAKQAATDYPPLNSAFIQFNEQIGAQLASTVTIPSLIEIQPKDVVWENLGITHTQRMIRTTFVTAAAAALIILWVFPVTFVASISNLKKIGAQLSFIGDVVDKLPPSVVGIIQGVLPALALQVLMGIVLPFILRSMSRVEGLVTRSGAAMSVQKKYYFFLVVNVLLVTTFANGIFGTLKQLRDNPTSAVKILAENLPSASTFFVTYILLSLSGAALQLCQLGPFVVHWIFKKWLAKTPRQIWNLEHTMGSIAWDIAFPTHTLMACIGLVYSAIQPVILPIVVLHFLLYKIAYTYNLLYVFETQNQGGGLTFVQAVYQMFTGLFLFELTMAGLFFLSTAFIPGVLMVILFGLTLGVLFAMLSIFKRNPSVEFLPVDLVGLLDVRHRKLLIAADGHQTYVKENLNEADSGEDEPINLPPEPEDVDADAFTHPAFIAQQPVVWLPEDRAGVARMEVEECYHNSIAASTEGAQFDEGTGHVSIDDMGPPETRSQQNRRNRH